MTTEYAPGTVAIATVRGVEGVRVFMTDTYGWVLAEAVTPGRCATIRGEVTDIRPLVVLDLGDDPEDIVDYLYTAAYPYLAAKPDEQWRLQRIGDQIRQQVRRPKPDEPTGLGAVVEDDRGERWVRMTDHEGANWHRWNAPEDVRPWRFYADIAAVRILSPGVDA